MEALSKLPKLRTVDLSDCDALDAVAACSALAQCSQLEELMLPDGAHVPLAALTAVAQLTRLTCLMMTCTKALDVQGLQQLSSLKRLQHLTLESSNGVTDDAIAFLAHLSSLTELSLWGCQQLRGSTLGQLAALSSLLTLDLRSCRLATIKGLELLPALQDLSLPDMELEAADLAPLSALTTLTSLLAISADITDECSALLRLPSLAWLSVHSISLNAPPAAGTLHQLTSIEVVSSGSLPRLLPLPQLQDLMVDETEDESDDNVSLLVTAISKQTTLTKLTFVEDMSQQQMQQLVAPLKQLQSFSAGFATDETTCLAACTALAELPLLRELMLWYVPQPAHLAMLARCTPLEELEVTWGSDVTDLVAANSLLLAALVCKPGLRRLCYPWGDGDGGFDENGVLEQMAAQAGVQLAEYGSE